MKKSYFILLFLLAFTLNKAQQTKNIQAFYNYAFSQDSLKGFDEAAATKAAISEQFLGEELQVRMYQVKREYINAKYHLISRAPDVTGLSGYTLYKTVNNPTLNCDFESSTAGTITVSNQIAGWTVGRGTHYPGPSGANSCNLLGYNNSAPVESELIVAPNGYIDPNIGSIYPIYSVFGSSSGDPNAEAANPQIAQGMYGDNFIRVNSDQVGNNAYSIEKLSKTFSVSADMKLFQFAFLSVLNAGHSCCDAGAIQIKLFDITFNNPIACPSFSASALSAGCTNTATGITYLNAISGTTVNPYNSGIIFNKWKVVSFDLSYYVGHTLSIELSASDCTGGGHFGYVYFDSNFTNYHASLNGNVYYMQNDTISLIGCPGNSNTVCAMSGIGPYSWQGTNLPSNYTNFSEANRCVVLNGPAVYELYSQSQICAPVKCIIKITPAPSIIATSTDNLICKGQYAVMFVNGNQHYINWSTGDTTNYVVVSPSITTTFTVFSQDIYGCSFSSSVTIEVQDCTGLNFHTQEDGKYTIYPNPNNGEFMVAATKSNGMGDIVIENTLGQAVFRQSLTLGDNLIKTKNLAAGLYYYSIYHAGLLVQKGKLKLN